MLPSAVPSHAAASSLVAATSPVHFQKQTDLNAATDAEIREALIRSPAIASKLLIDRSLHGPFLSFSEVQKRVHGIGPKKIQQMRMAGIVIGAVAQNSPEVIVQTQVDAAGVQVFIDPMLQQPSESNHTNTNETTAESHTLPASSPLLNATISSSSSITTGPSPPPPAPEVMFDSPAPAPSVSTARPLSPPSPWTKWYCCSCGSPETSKRDTASPQQQVNRDTQENEPTTMNQNIELEMQTRNLTIVAPLAPIPAPELPVAPTRTPAPAAATVPALVPVPAPIPTPPPLTFSPPPPRPSPPAVSAIRVGSWNLCHYGTPKANNPSVMSIICDVILRHEYDVIVLLEVRSQEACEILINQYLNNPNRLIPPDTPQTVRDSVGEWKFVISDYVEYGSDASFSVGKSAQIEQAEEIVLDAEIIEEEITAEGGMKVQSTQIHGTASECIVSSGSTDATDTTDTLISSLSTLQIQSSTTTAITEDGLSAQLVRTSISEVDVLVTPVKKRASSPTGLSSTPHHRTTSSSARKSAGGYGHKKKEYYAFVYRADRVNVRGCRLYQTKAGIGSIDASSPTPPASPGADSPVSTSKSHKWWRSPCTALVEPLHASSPALSWLLVALHIIWGDGDSDILRECQHLQRLYSDCARERQGENTAVVMLGDFNWDYFEEGWDEHCLPKEKCELRGAILSKCSFPRSIC
jgi:hypothetical protein